MLLNLTGSSCAGKSTLAWAIAELVGPDVVVADYDELGVPDQPSGDWRLDGNEWWIRRALGLQAEGRHLLLTGQTPLGELLASPSAPMLEGIAHCLIDVDDRLRLRRLDERDPEKWSEREREAFVEWGRWHRGHAVDPRSRPEVIVRDSSVPVVWTRWTDWRAGDPRWSTAVIDTTSTPLVQCVAQLERWVERQLELLAAGTLPLRPGWEDRSAP